MIGLYTGRACTCHLQVGIVLGLAIYNNIILDVHFPPVVYKVGAAAEYRFVLCSWVIATHVPKHVQQISLLYPCHPALRSLPQAAACDCADTVHRYTINSLVPEGVIMQTRASTLLLI